jgi:hypothetical protein
LAQAQRNGGLSRIADLERQCGEGCFDTFNFVCAYYIFLEQPYAFLICIFVIEIKGAKFAMRMLPLFLTSVIDP